MGYVLPIAFLAYVVKSATGFGPALVVVGLGTLAIGAENAIPLAAVLDIVSGVALLWQTRTEPRAPLWRPMAVAMGTGAVAGSALFSVLQADSLARPLGVVIIVSTLALLAVRLRPSGHAARPTLRTPVAVPITAGGGFLGGLLGVGGPPVAVAVSLTFPKTEFRSLLTPVFLTSATVRLVSYAVYGTLTTEAVQAAGLALLVLPAGAWLGNRLHGAMSDRVFDGAVAALLLVTGARLLT